MHRLLISLALVVALPLAAQVVAHRESVSGWCEQGNKTVSFPGVPSPSSTKVQQSFPSCTVTVYTHGTVSLATIYSDDTGTALANPFTANSDGSYQFFADDGRFDVIISGGGMSTPFTHWNRQVFDYRFYQPGAYPPATGAVSRSLKSKVAEVVSVKDFGATGDGSTDDTTSIQAAIDYVTMNGGKVTIPPGEYKITGNPALTITSQITVEGVFETARSDRTTPIGALLKYAGTGTAIQIKNGTGYIYRVKLKNFRLAVPVGTVGGTGLECTRMYESEIDHISIGDGYSAPSNGFTTAIYCTGCSQLVIRDSIISMGQADGVGINLDAVDAPAGGGLNSQVLIHRNNFFRTPSAAIKIGSAMSVSILDNWIEGASSAILVDSLLPGSTGVFINGLTVENNTYANPTAQFPEYPNPRFLRVTHGDITKGVSILGAVFERNVVSVETSSYAVQFSYATSTAPSNDNAVTYWKNNHLWGATTSGVYSDSNKVATHSRNNDARSSWYGATVAVVSGSGFYTDVLDANGITNHKTEVDFTGPVYINNGTGLLQLEGTAESFLSLFVNGTQHGWFGFSPGGNKNLAVKNTYSTGGLYLQTTGGGVIHLNGANVTLGPTDFSAAGTLSVQDSTPATGVTTFQVVAGAAQSTTPIATFYDSAWGPKFNIYADGSVQSVGKYFAALGTPSNGTFVFCLDCTANSNPCTGSGLGAFAKRLNGAWDCR